MDKETARKAKDFLARRDVKGGPLLDPMATPYPIFPPGFTPGHFPPGTFPPESFPHHASATYPRERGPFERSPFQATGETANKAGKDREKNNQVPASDIATNGSVTDDAQDNAPKTKVPNFREDFERFSKELDAMDKKEREAKFPHHKYTSTKGCSAEVAFQYLMDEVGSI
ncbi:hypothetical protein ACHAPT_013432 [Fusarium lateritium]